MSLITNLYADPKALRPLAVWGCDASKNSDGKYVYTGYSDNWAAMLGKVPQGCVVAVDFNTSRRDAFTLEHCQITYNGPTALAGVYDAIGNCSLYCTDGNGFSVTVNRIGMYSQDDWKRLQEYGLDWFDGDTMPLQ